jgi:hypothetical protein
VISTLAFFFGGAPESCAHATTDEDVQKKLGQQSMLEEVLLDGEQVCLRVATEAATVDAWRRWSSR